MKNIKKLILISVLGAGVCQQSVYADAATQAKIRNVIKAHEHKLNSLKTSDELKKFLHVLIKDLKEALKHAPNTQEYKKLKDALNSMNPDQLVSIMANLKTILNHLEPDIKNTIVDAIPMTFRALLML
jgi:hypothetical protein